MYFNLFFFDLTSRGNLDVGIKQFM